ncbi:MAG: capsid protein [Caudoviricetes sp.]|nr:MAG: capsid protein [Caudoviricetes sp.]
MNRAYSTMTVKAVNEEQRIITGIASTPSADRAEDIMVPEGAQYTLPMPCLWQHEDDEPIGHVIGAKVTSRGIEATIQIAQVQEEGKLKDRLDEAWQSIKAGLVRGLSIGFLPIESQRIEGSWGSKYLKWDWYELSVVTIPCNVDARITSVKSASRKQLAALGKSVVPVVRIAKPAGASAQKPVVKTIPKPEEGLDMKTIAEQIAEFEATRVTKSAEMQSIMDKAAEDGTTLDAEQSEAFDTLEAELGAIDKHVSRLKNMQKAAAASAKAVSAEGLVKTVDTSGITVRAKNTQKLEPGIAFARAAKCLALGHLEHRDAIQIAKSMYEGQDHVIEATQRLVTKAAVAPATTTDATWAKPLVGTESSAFADFIEFLRPQTIVGRFGQAGIPSLRRIPFRTALIGQTSGGDAFWTGESQAKPVTKFDFTRTTLEPLKLANIAVATMEVIRDSSPSAEGIIRDQLAAALRQRLDIDFINPAKAAVVGISPASILNGVAGIPSSGNDADAVRADIRALFNQFIAANNAPTSGVWIMSATTALALSLMQNPLGQAEFPGITMTGGVLFGLPAIISEFVPSDSGGSLVALVNASDIYYADEGGIDVSMSTEASLQMDNAPDNPTTASTVLVSLWQRNLVGLRCELSLNFQRRRPSAVAWLDNVNWGE